jgi:AcrR family transcriptional regulator
LLKQNEIFNNHKNKGAINMSPRIGLDLHTILLAATEIADTKGLEEVTLAALAQKLEIRSPSLYNHVNGLQGLRKKLAIYGVEQLGAELTRAAVGRSGDDAIREIAKAYLAFARHHPGLYESTLRAADPEDTELQRAGGEVVGLLVQVLQIYGLQDEAAIHAVRALRSLMHGFASLEHKGGFGMKLGLDETFRFMVDTFLAGIQAMRSEKSKLPN